MSVLQDDLLEMYNNLTEFSKAVAQAEDPVPIKVWFDKEGIESPLVFEHKGTTVRLRLPIYYCLALEELLGKGSYLLAEDYKYLMDTLMSVIHDNRILDNRGILVSPENYGFDVYAIDITQFQKGLELIGRVRFITSNDWWFKAKVKWKFRKLW